MNPSKPLLPLLIGAIVLVLSAFPTRECPNEQQRCQVRHTMTVHSPRPYQADVEKHVWSAWEVIQNVLVVMPTGSGKTFTFASIISKVPGAVCTIAHRQELVTQISLALAREGVRHRIIGSAAVARACSAEHMERLGRDFVTQNARVAVASVDTLIRLPDNDPWFTQVQLWVLDEAHHIVAKPEANKWGKAVARFVNARGLGVTATPLRADGRGLGRHADGAFDEMIVGPTMRELINLGFLCDYRLIDKPSNIKLSDDWVGASGDYSKDKLSAARADSSITGDVVQHYLKFAAGKLGVTFDVDVQSATETAAAFRAAGVPAEVVSAKTPDEARRAILRRFRNRELLQLVNVDLFGEGFDLPAIEVVSMARPTQSYSLYVQQFGRALRIMDGKDRAIIIDHVSNRVRHGLPDAYREWSLDRRERRSRSAPSDVVPTRTCMNPACCSVFERFLKACPFCGTEIVIMDRSRPEFVDGDLVELDPEVLAKLRGEVARVDGPVLYPTDLSIEARMALNKHHMKRQVEQSSLRNVMALWAGWQSHMGRALSEQYVRFFHRYGLDVATAMALKTRDAEALRARIQADLDKHGVVST